MLLKWFQKWNKMSNNKIVKKDFILLSLAFLDKVFFRFSKLREIHARFQEQIVKIILALSFVNTLEKKTKKIEIRN